MYPYLNIIDDHMNSGVAPTKEYCLLQSATGRHRPNCRVTNADDDQNFVVVEDLHRLISIMHEPSVTR